jgi:hypothetical protein
MALGLGTLIEDMGAKVTCALPLASHQLFRFEVVSSSAESILEHLEKLGHERPRPCGTAPRFHPKAKVESRPTGPKGEMQPSFVEGFLSATTYSMELSQTYMPNHGDDIKSQDSASRPRHSSDNSKPQPALAKGADIFAAHERRR